MTIAELYGLTHQDGASADRARALLRQSHWFSVNAEFDPKTGGALPQALSAFLAKVAHPKQVGPIQDRLHRITEHARSSVERLLRSLNESPRREQALLPVHAVRELDANSFIKLSNRPGRNIREKLAGKPYLQAVRRYQSVNLPENRLLKTFVIRLAELLELRRNVLGEEEDDLVPKIHSWLRGDQSQTIASWENLPPNNTLLAHRDYRRIWDSWRRLQTLDNDIARDLSHSDVRRKTLTRWMDFGRIYGEGAHLFAEMPVLFDYENFSIQTWLPEPLIERTARKCVRHQDRRTVAVPSCVDLVAIRPRFAIAERGSQALTDAYLWQQWRSDSETVAITLFDSDSVYLHPDAVTIASPDLFFGDDNTSDCWDRAACAFADRLKDTFKDDKLIWLVPDAVNDFELDTIRRNLNARFPAAEPLPRSVAALFEQVDYNRITKDGYAVLVLDTIGGTTCATKLIARFDADLRTRLPETKGFYWERLPPVIISENDEVRTKRPLDITTVDCTGKFHQRATPEGPRFIDAAQLRKDQRIGNFSFCISIADSPVVGGMRLHSWQLRAVDIPLWRDQIPELSVKLIKDGLYQRFNLVSHGKTTIKPIRGLSVPIPIAKHFTLPAGKRYYQFQLFQGESAAELTFSARLDSPAFPLKSDTNCELALSCQYGDDETYTLVFVPLEHSFTPVRGTWKRTEEEIVTDAPAPIYPEPLTWADLQRMPKPGSNETSDLLEWAVSAVDRLLRRRTVGTLATDWRIDRKGYNYAHATCDEAESVIIHERNFVGGVTFSSFAVGSQLSFELQDRDGKFSGAKVARPEYVEELWEVINSIRKRVYFPFIQVWRDGRSIKDIECPKPFTTAAAEKIALLTALARQDDLPAPLKREIFFLLACVHKDTSDECVAWISNQVESLDIRNPRVVGFALGDVSQEWQQDIFHRLVSHPNTDTLSAFAYAIWRERYFVERFSLSGLKTSLHALLERLSNICSVQASDLNNNSTGGNWERATTESLELLLGLLRTRTSDDPEIRTLLQPHQKITKRLAEQIERIEGIVAASRITLFSRVQIDVQKPESICSPDLLYASRLYLTGDDGANAIHITGISDTDD